MAKAELIELSQEFLNPCAELLILYRREGGELITLESKYREADGISGRQLNYSWQSE